MKITFINHASFLLESQATSVWCDPWTMGKINNNCNALYSPSAQVPIERVENIWLSHEHADHFHFPTLKSIPVADRERITFLHQKHSSPRVIEAVRKLGFKKIKELPQFRWVTLKAGFEVFCGCVGTMDSFLVVRTEGECILNMNDCICTDAEIRYIHRLVGRPTTLLTQFSNAQWIGNRADDIDAVRQKMREFKYQVLTFRPEFTVAFASFMYCCSQENSWMNDFMITPARVMAMNLPGVNFMYPGDVWDSTECKFNTEEAVARYTADLEKLEIDPTPPSVDAETIRQAALKLLEGVRKRLSRFVLWRVKPFEVYTHDTDCIFRIYPAQGRCEVRPATQESAARARYVMCSQVAWYAFAHTWGWNVLQGTGTFIDRQFKEEGEDVLWRWCVTEFSTDILAFNSPRRFFRTLGFLWGKKFELFYHLFGKRVSDEAVRKVSGNEPAATLPSVVSQ
jgi:UDP-MurNAc hydroxylase